MRCFRAFLRDRGLSTAATSIASTSRSGPRFADTRTSSSESSSPELSAAVAGAAATPRFAALAAAICSLSFWSFRFAFFAAWPSARAASAARVSPGSLTRGAFARPRLVAKALSGSFDASKSALSAARTTERTYAEKHFCAKALTSGRAATRASTCFAAEKVRLPLIATFLTGIFAAASSSAMRGSSLGRSTSMALPGRPLRAARPARCR
mmetsp:Transcript_22701/g.74284  ORF Transcript_22701/g.74284 Transcript_22701/m.74284 type:complete len:210 (-) Transcript_22701:37-666(-)